MTFLSILDKHTPREMKYIRSTSRNFMTKELKRAIMNRSKLRNKNFLKTKNQEYIKDVLIVKEMPKFQPAPQNEKTVFLKTLAHRVVSDNRKF